MPSPDPPQTPPAPSTFTFAAPNGGARRVPRTPGEHNLPRPPRRHPCYEAYKLKGGHESKRRKRGFFLRVQVERFPKKHHGAPKPNANVLHHAIVPHVPVLVSNLVRTITVIVDHLRFIPPLTVVPPKTYRNLVAYLQRRRCFLLLGGGVDHETVPEISPLRDALLPAPQSCRRP